MCNVLEEEGKCVLSTGQQFLPGFPWERRRLACFGNGQDGRAPRLQVTRAPWYLNNVRVLSQRHRVHRLPWMGLLIDYNKPQLVFKTLQATFGTAASAALAWCAGAGQLVPIPLCLGLLQRRQQLLKLVQR